MSIFIVREASLSDLEKIRQLSFELFKKEFHDFDITLNMDWTFSDSGKEYFTKKIIGEKDLALVAEIDGKIVGYLAAEIKENKKSHNPKMIAELENIFILPEVRSQSIGANLVSKFKDWAKNNGIHRIKVVASAANEAAIRFYHRLGFEDYNLSLEGDI